MSNKVKIERICEHCGTIFIAQTCKTRFCSKVCNSRHYKESIRSGRYNIVTKEIKEEKRQLLKLSIDEIEFIQAKEYISLKQFATYLGVGKRSIYNYIHKKKEKTGNTTLYSKKNVDDIKNAQIGEDGYITIPEACIMFNVDRDTIYNRCQSYKIPKINKGKFVIVSVEGLRKVFGSGNIAINNVNELPGGNKIEETNSDKQNESITK